MYEAGAIPLQSMSRSPSPTSLNQAVDKLGQQVEELHKEFVASQEREVLDKQANIKLANFAKQSESEGYKFLAALEKLESKATTGNSLRGKDIGSELKNIREGLERAFTDLVEITSIALNEESEGDTSIDKKTTLPFSPSITLG